MRRIAVVLAALALSLSGVAPARADHSGPVWWHERAVTIEDRTGYGYVREATAQAVSRWNESGAHLTLVYRNGPVGAPCSNNNGTVITVCVRTFTGDAASFVANSSAAWGGANNFVGAHLELNAAIFTTTPRPETFTAVAHEMGHTIGLGHSAVPGSVMGGGSTPGPHDFEALRSIYGFKPPVIAGSAWYSDGTRSRTVQRGASVTAYATGAMSGVPYYLTLATAGCATPLLVLNVTAVHAGSTGVIGRVTGTVPATTAPGTYSVCFHSGGGTPTATGAVSLVVAA